MSLRFLKAKPKLNLSKDKKVRSVSRNQEPKTDGQGQSTNEKKIQEEKNKNTQETDGTKLDVLKTHSQDTLNCKLVDTNTKEFIREIESSAENQQLSGCKQNEERICVKNTKVNLKNVASSEIFFSTEKTAKEVLIDNPVLQEIHSKKCSIDSMNNSAKEKDTPASKSPISPMKNVSAFPEKCEVPVVPRHNKFTNLFKETEDKINKKESSVEINEQVISKSTTNRNSTNIQKKTSTQRSDFEKLAPELKKISPKTEESPTKTKSLSSYIKQLEHDKKQLPSQEKNSSRSRPIVEKKAPSSKKRNYKDTTAIPAVTSIIKNTEIEETCDSERNTSIVSASKPEYSFPLCKEENNELFNSIEKKQVVKKSSTKIIEARIKKISNLIEENMNLLKNSQPSLKKKSNIITEGIPDKSSNKVPKLDSSGSNENYVKRDLNKSEQGNIILTEENIQSIPIIMSTTSVSFDGSIIEKREILPLIEDHMYAKPNCANISLSEEMRTSHSKESSITRPERSLASVKIKNLTHEEKKWIEFGLQPSKFNGLNAFQRALILEEGNGNEDDQMSEASECEATSFVDVNARTFNNYEEDAAVNQISYSFHSKEFQEFSGLCLVTKFIKEENGDLSCPEMKSEKMKSEFTYEKIGTESTDNSNYIEENVVYSDNIVYIEDSTCNDNIIINEASQEVLQYNMQQQDPNKTQRKCNKNLTPKPHRNVTFNFTENIKHESKDTKIKIENKSRKRKIKEEISDDESKNRKENETNNAIHVDSEVTKRTVKIKKDEDYEYLPVDELYDSSSDLEIDIDERNFVIHGKKMKGMKKKPSESIFLKRQHETLKKIKTEPLWKENLTVSDLIFYNPESNPMTNPPDFSIVKTKNETILGKTEPSETLDQCEDEEAIDNPEPVPRLKISADGKLIVDPKSLIIEETGLKKSKDQLLHSEALVESKYTIKKFDNLYSKRKIKRTTNDWSPEDTIMFYRAVNTIGTDFSMMATLFENKTRACIKRKFKLEERKNPTLLSKALRNFNSFDIDELKSELNADRLRAERIKKEEKYRLEMIKIIKRENKRRKRSQTKVKSNTSLCGKLIKDSIEKNPPYVKSDLELYV